MQSFIWICNACGYQWQPSECREVNQPFLVLKTNLNLFNPHFGVSTLTKQRRDNDLSFEMLLSKADCTVFLQVCKGDNTCISYETMHPRIIKLLS